jgi:hypothetical protein
MPDTLRGGGSVAEDVMVARAALAGFQGPLLRLSAVAMDDFGWSWVGMTATIESVVLDS